MCSLYFSAITGLFNFKVGAVREEEVDAVKYLKVVHVVMVTHLTQCQLQKNPLPELSIA